MNIPLELWNFAKSLPKAQRRKVIDALCSIFFDYTLPDDLPPTVLTALGGWDGRIACARKVSFVKRGLSEEEAIPQPKQNPAEINENFFEDSSEIVSNCFEDYFSLNDVLAAETQENIGTSSLQIEIEREKSKSRSESISSAAIPTREEVREYMKHCGIREFDPDKFVDHYERANWKTKDRKPINDWRGMIRQWQQHEGEITRREGRDKKEKRSKNELKLMGRDSKKGTWIYTGGRNGCDYLEGSEDWTESQAKSALRKLQQKLISERHR